MELGALGLISCSFSISCVLIMAGDSKGKRFSALVGCTVTMSHHNVMAMKWFQGILAEVLILL